MNVTSDGLVDRFRWLHSRLLRWLVLATLMSCAFLTRMRTAAADETNAAGSGRQALIDFRYDAPKGCPSATDAFARIVGRSPRIKRSTVAGGADIRLSMDFLKKRDEYLGVLTVERLSNPSENSKPEKRRMRGVSCSEVVDALALTATLSLELEASYPLEKKSNTEALTQENEPDRDPAPEPDALGPPRSLIWSIGPQFSGEVIMTGSPHLGAGVVASLRRPGGTRIFPLEFSANLRILLEAPFLDDEEVNTTLILLSISYCPLRLGTQLALLFCPTMDSGVVSAKGQNIARSIRATRFFYAPGLTVPLRWQFSQSAELKFSPSLGFPTTKRTFALDHNEGIATETRNMTFDAAVSLSYVFE